MNGIVVSEAPVTNEVVQVPIPDLQATSQPQVLSSVQLQQQLQLQLQSEQHFPSPQTAIQPQLQLESQQQSLSEAVPELQSDVQHQNPLPSMQPTTVPFTPSSIPHVAEENSDLEEKVKTVVSKVQY